MLYLFDARDEAAEVLRKKQEFDELGVNYLMVANKVDLAGEEEARDRFAVLGEPVFISAKENRHTEVLKERMIDKVLQGQVQTENSIVTNARHYHALKEVEHSLLDVRSGLANKLPGDLLALDIRRCLHYLGEITGEITTEDQLDYIFSKFCIGK